MVSRTVDKAEENDDIQEYEKKGQVIYLNKDLGQACPNPSTRLRLRVHLTWSATMLPCCLPITGLGHSSAAQWLMDSTR